MKNLKLKFSVLIALLFFTTLQVRATDFFQDLDDCDDVSAVYISKNLISQARVPIARVRQVVSMDDLKLESIAVYDAEKKSGMEACKKAMKNFRQTNPNLDMLMLSRDEDGEVTMLYGLPVEGSDTYSVLVVYTEDSDEVCIVVLTGQIKFDGKS